MEQRINISISINDKYVTYAYVMLNSLFMHHVENPVTVYILQSGLTEESRTLLQTLGESWKQEIVFVNVSLGQNLADTFQGEQENAVELLPTTENWSMEMYYRLLLGELLPPEAERVLYLDVDIIVNKNLAEFYFQDMGQWELAAADDVMVQGNFSAEQQRLFEQQAEVRYFNSGVLLYNLKQLRNRYTFATYLSVARQYNYQLTNPDQDLLNFIHNGKIIYIENSVYNVFSQTAELELGGYEYLKEQGAIIHFAGRKPWNYNGVHYGAEKIWWDYAKETPFYQGLLERVFYDGLRDDSYQTIMGLLKENSELKKNLNEAMAICQKLLKMQ